MLSQKSQRFAKKPGPASVLPWWPLSELVEGRGSLNELFAIKPLLVFFDLIRGIPSLLIIYSFFNPVPLTRTRQGLN